MKVIKKKIIADFLNFEKKNKFDKIEFKKKKIWKIIRYAVFYYIINEKQYSYEKNQRKKLNFEIVNKIFKSFLTIKNIFGRCDVLIYDYGRPQKIGRKVANPLSYGLSQSLSKNLSLCFISKDYNHTSNVINEKQKSINIYLIYKLLLYLFVIITRFSGINKIKTILKNKIFKAYKKNINLDSVIYNVFCHQVALGIIFEIIFIIKKPKVIFYSDNAELIDTIFRANRRNIVTVDVQHSIVSDLKILYQHNSSNDLNYLSKYILTFSDYWNKFYSSDYSKVSVGNYLYDYYQKKYKNKSSSKNITIISSIVSRKKLINLAKLLSLKFPRKKIIYKLRPEEYRDWKLIYPKSLRSLKNVFFVDNEKKELYEHLFLSEFVIGTNSTVLLQAIAFSRVIVIKSGWYNELKPLIDDGLVKYAKNKSDLLRLIEGGSVKSKKKLSTILYKDNFKKNLRLFTKSINL